MRELITTALEVAGLVLIAAGLGAGAAIVSTPLGLVVAGLALVGESWWINRPPRKPKPAESEGRP